MTTLSMFVIAAALLAGGVWAGRQLFRSGFEFDTRVEERRRAAAKLAAVLMQHGLAKVPDLLIDYSVGDYSGMGCKVIEVTKLFLSGEAAVMEEFQQVFSNVLAAKLRTEEGRAYIQAKLDETEAAEE